MSAVFRSRLRRRVQTVAAIAAILLFTAPRAWGQAQTPSLADLGKRLQLGKTASVVTTTGDVLEGSLAVLSADSLTLRTADRLHVVAAGDVKQIRQRQADSRWNGVLIGAAAGAVYALTWFVKDPNECRNVPCPGEIVGFPALGGLIGFGIDSLIKRTVIVQMPAHLQTRPKTALGRQVSFGASFRF